MAAVAEDSAADVAFPEVGHIDECHASGAVAEQEQVACHGERGSVPERYPVEGGDRLLAHGPFHGPFNAGVDVAERVGLPGKSFACGLVVCCSEHSHIEGQGIAADSPSVQPVCVALHEAVRDGAHRYVPASEEGRQAVGGAEVVVGCPVPSIGLHCLAGTPDISYEITGLPAFPEQPCHVFCGVAPALQVETGSDVPDQVLSVFYLYPDVGQAAVLFSFLQPFPFVCADVDSG